MDSKLAPTVRHLYGHRVATVLNAAAEKAQDGKMNSVALLAVLADGSLEFRLAGAYERAPKEATHDLLKFLEALLARD